MFNYIIFPIILPTILIANLFWFENSWIGIIFGFIFLLLCGFKLGILFFQKENKFWKLFFGIPLFCAIIITISTPIYYFYQFNNFVIAFVILLIVVALFLLKTKFYIKTYSAKDRGYDIKLGGCKLLSPLIFLFIILEIFLYYILFKSQTIDAIRTPWQIIDEKFLIIYFFASLALVLLFFQKKNNVINLILLSTHSFLTLGLGLIVYKIGYGFDPFIHRATENLIYNFGEVSPKPFYYIGQYTLVVFLSKILMVSLAWVDKLLLPIFTAVFLPPTIYWSFKKIYGNISTISIAPFFFLSVPLTSFIATTPQGLANFFVLFLIFLSIGFKNFFVLTLIALATSMIHPLAGIPVLIFIGFCGFQEIKNSKVRYPLLILLFLISIIIIPLIFIIKEVIFYDSWQGILKSAEWGNINFSLPKLENRYSLFYDFAYNYKNNLLFLIIILSMIGMWIAKKHKSLPFFLCAVIVAINAIPLKLFINFKDVIFYEQTDYANRLLQIASYFLFPLCFFAIIYFFEKLKNTNFLIKSFFILIFTALATFSIYLTYPRVDGYDLSHNINTSFADINAVHFIEENSGGEDYIVLANQAVSAAALQEFGFKKYYQIDDNEIFYYPIPTGGKLYRYYLDMVYEEPSRETMIGAMNLVGVKKGYFVLNKYWTNSERILEKAKLTADEWWSLDNNAIFVLKYIVTNEE